MRRCASIVMGGAKKLAVMQKTLKLSAYLPYRTFHNNFIVTIDMHTYSFRLLYNCIGAMTKTIN